MYTLIGYTYTSFAAPAAISVHDTLAEAATAYTAAGNQIGLGRRALGILMPDGSVSEMPAATMRGELLPCVHRQSGPQGIFGSAARGGYIDRSALASAPHLA